MPNRATLIALMIAASSGVWVDEARGQEPTEQQILEALRAVGADTLVGQLPDTTRAADDTLSGAIPPPDPLYQRLEEAAAGEEELGSGPILYQGRRLVFYPQSEVIVLEGEAAAQQVGTTLKAHRILYRSREGVVEAFGQASVSRGPSELGADSLFYDRETGAVATFGASLLREGESVTKGFDLRYDLERRSGLLGGGVTTYAPWVLVGDQMSKIGESTFLVDDGHFTTCELEDPHYRFVSDEIKLRKDDVIVASPIVLYFSDVPVFFLPWYVEPVVRGRHSGFLRPKIGINTLLFGSGRERNVQDIGYYYVFGDYADALVGADWYTESRFIVRFDARYHARYRFQGNAAIEQVWNRVDESSSRLIRYRHDQTLSRTSRASVDVNWSNSRRFLQQNSFDPEQILQRSFRSAASYTTRFDWGALVAGSDADFRLDVNRTDYRLADVRLSINQRPLWGRRPTSGTDLTERPFWQTLQYSANAQGVARLSRAQVDPETGLPLPRIPVDSLGRPIPGEVRSVTNQQEGRFQLTLNGPLNLFGAINTTPSIAFNGSILNDELGENAGLGGEGRLNTGINFSTRFFRIFQRPIGPFLAMRHTMAPVISVSYSPKPTFWGVADPASEGRESFFANLSLSQDLDVKMPVEETADADTAASEATQDETGEQPEVPTRTVNLLNVTNSLGFDVTRHREPDRIGFQTLSTRITSGLGQTFNLSASLVHNLVDTDSEGRESFSPFLSTVTTDFSISRGGGRPTVRQRDLVERDVQAGRGAEDDVERAREGFVTDHPVETGFGPWSLHLTHSWNRNREGGFNRQSLGIGTQLLPSPGWSLRYQTNYDITDTEFQGQTLALVRELHDWTATLNVNFFPSEPQDRVLVAFSVFLTEAPDLQVPYRVRRE